MLARLRQGGGEIYEVVADEARELRGVRLCKREGAGGQYGSEATKRQNAINSYIFMPI